MSLPLVTLIGAGIGAIVGALIFFEPREPYKVGILLASTLRNALVALVVGLSIRPESSWLVGAGFGLLYGFWSGLIIFLAKGGTKSHDAPFVLPGATLMGGVTGLLIVVFCP